MELGFGMKLIKLTASYSKMIKILYFDFSL